MKRLLVSLVLVGTAACPLYGQGVATRDVKIGNMRITEISEALAAPKSPARVGVPTATNPQTGDRKADKPNGNPIAPAAGKADDSKKQSSAIRDAAAELDAAIRSLNPSYAIAPVLGSSAMTAGSYYIRTSAVPVQVGFPVSPMIWMATPPLVLPSPAYLGGWGYPSWLYSGTVRVDVQPVPAVRAVAGEDNNGNELSALREEVRKLREQVEKLSGRQK